MSRVLFILFFGIAILPAVARAQSASDLMEQGIRAYAVREYDGGAWLLRRALSLQGPGSLSAPDQSRALMYLSATELARDQRDSAFAAARRLIALDPRYRPDEQAFSPQAIALLQDARRATPGTGTTGSSGAPVASLGAVGMRAIGDSAIRPGVDNFAIRLSSTMTPEITAAVTTAEGRVVRTLFTGTLRDSIDLRWNGLDVSGNSAPPGRYIVSVTPTRRAGWTLKMPLEVARQMADTTPLPPEPPDSLFRPERGDYPGAWRALMPGILASAAIIVVPKLVASGERPSGARLFVGGTVAIAGVAAFLSHRPGRELPANTTYNRNLRESWRRNAADISRRNADRLRQTRMIIRAGQPVLTTPETGGGAQ